MKSERGKFLTVMIVWSLIGALLTLISFGFPDLIKIALSSYPSWVAPFAVISGIMLLIASIGLWQMKKWGVYLFGISEVLNFIATLAIMKAPLTLLTFLVFIFLIVWAISRKWKSFS